MLNVWMWNGSRRFSQSGTCCTVASSATSSGSSRSAPATRNTPVVWYDWFPGVTTTKSCATATHSPSMTNVPQPGVSSVNRERNGNVAAAAAATTSQK